MSHSEHAYSILSGFFIAKPFWRFKRGRELRIPAFDEVMLIIHKPTDLCIMASRDAVKIHVHPRSLLSATQYSLFKI
jgi:hypothetical protein